MVLNPASWLRAVRAPGVKPLKGDVALARLISHSLPAFGVAGKSMKSCEELEVWSPWKCTEHVRKE